MGVSEQIPEPGAQAWRRRRTLPRTAFGIPLHVFGRIYPADICENAAEIQNNLKLMPRGEFHCIVLFRVVKAPLFALDPVPSSEDPDRVKI